MSLNDRDFELAQKINFKSMMSDMIDRIEDEDLAEAAYEMVESDYVGSQIAEKLMK